MKIIYHKILPQWIISSDKAAYHPFTKTIHTTNFRYIPHELIHWVVDCLGISKLHIFIDKRRSE